MLTLFEPIGAIIVQLNPRKNDTIRTLVYLYGPDWLHMGVPPTPTVPGLQLSLGLGPVPFPSCVTGALVLVFPSSCML